MILPGPGQQMPTGPMPGAMPAGPSPEDEPRQIVMEAMQEQPELFDAVMQAAQQGIATGQFGPTDVQKVGQLALATLREPDVYPQLAQLASQTGVLPQMPEQPDPVLIAALATVGAEVGNQARGPGQGQQEPGVPSLAKGGYIPLNLPGGQMKANVHAGEYVLPPDVVQHYGVDKLDKMVDASRKQPSEKMGKDLTETAESPRNVMSDKEWERARMRVESAINTFYEDLDRMAQSGMLPRGMAPRDPATMIREKQLQHGRAPMYSGYGG